MNNNIKIWSLLVGVIVPIFALLITILIPEIREYFGLSISSKVSQSNTVIKVDSVKLFAPNDNPSKNKIQEIINSDANVKSGNEPNKNEIAPLELGNKAIKIRRNKPEDHEKIFGHLVEETDSFIPINKN